jgi:hypothetical protein
MTRTRAAKGRCSSFGERALARVCGTVCLGAVATALFLGVAVVGCQRSTAPQATGVDMYDKEFATALWEAPSGKAANKKAEEMLNDIDDPARIRHLAKLCNELMHLPKGQEPDVDPVHPGNSRGARFYLAWEICVARLRDLGRVGNADAIRELWDMHTGPEHYDAGGGELIMTCIWQVGEPAIPFLQELVQQGNREAGEMIEAIQSGERWE